MVSKIYQICNAYESGYGHGWQKDEKKGDYYNDLELCEAYNIGYDSGCQQKNTDHQQKNTDYVEKWVDMITYSHKNGPKHIRFCQHKKDKIPDWAIDISIWSKTTI